MLDLDAGETEGDRVIVLYEEDAAGNVVTDRRAPVPDLDIRMDPRQALRDLHDIVKRA